MHYACVWETERHLGMQGKKRTIVTIRRNGPPGHLHCVSKNEAGTPIFDSRVNLQIQQQDRLVRVIASVSQKLYTDHLSASSYRVWKEKLPPRSSESYPDHWGRGREGFLGHLHYLLIGEGIMSDSSHRLVQQPYEKGTILTPILQVGRQRHRDVK